MPNYGFSRVITVQRQHTHKIPLIHDFLEEVGVELGDLFVDEVEEQPCEEYVEVEFFFILEQGVLVLNIFSQVIK